MSLKATAAPPALFSSNAQRWIAPSIWRRLLMQAFFWDVVRALTKLGIAIAAKRPIMATTIMISTNVKPLLRDVLMFILLFFPLRRERNNRWISISSIFGSLITC